MKFRAMIVHGLLHRLWAKLTHQHFRLLDLDETMKGHPAEAGHFAGLKTVSIDRIRGTQGKTDEFDSEFNPTQERFNGGVEIALVFDKPTKEMWLHGQDLAVSEAQLTTPDGRKLMATYAPAGTMKAGSE